MPHAVLRHYKTLSRTSSKVQQHVASPSSPPCCSERSSPAMQDFVSAAMDVDFSPTGREFVAGSYDRSVRIFAYNGGHSREVYHTKRMQRVFAVRFSGDGSYVFSGSDDMNVRIWKVCPGCTALPCTLFSFTPTLGRWSTMHYQHFALPCSAVPGLTWRRGRDQCSRSSPELDLLQGYNSCLDTAS